jgi:hypothetical protein
MQTKLFGISNSSMTGIFDLEEDSSESKQRVSQLLDKYPFMQHYVEHSIETNRPLRPEQREKIGVPSMLINVPFYFVIHSCSCFQ